jgi:ribosomal protein S18
MAYSRPSRSSVPLPRRPFFRRRKTCPFTGDNAPKIDYKDVKTLQRFISERGKIVPSRITTRLSSTMIMYALFRETRGSVNGRISSLALAKRITPFRWRLPSLSMYPLGNVNEYSVFNSIDQSLRISISY